MTSKKPRTSLTAKEKRWERETKRPSNPQQQSQEGNSYQNTVNQGYHQGRKGE